MIFKKIDDYYKEYNIGDMDIISQIVFIKENEGFIFANDKDDNNEYLIEDYLDTLDDSDKDILQSKIYILSEYAENVKYIIQNNELIIDDSSYFEEKQKEKMLILQSYFEDIPKNGKFKSSLGFWVDNRRYYDKNDKENVQSLIDLGEEPIYFRDADNNFHQITLEELTKIKTEMIKDGLFKYQWKWNIESRIMNAGTIEELEDIEILFVENDFTKNSGN